MIKIQNNIYILCAGFVTASILLVAVLILPVLNDIERGYKEILLNKNNAVSMSLQKTQLDDFKKKYQVYRPHLEKINSAFIDEKNPVDFIKFLEAIAVDSAVVVDVNIVPSSKSENTSSNITFQIFAEGEFLDILHFYEKLEVGHYLMSIKSLTIKNAVQDMSDKKNSNNGVEANFLIEVLAHS